MRKKGGVTCRPLRGLEYNRSLRTRYAMVQEQRGETAPFTREEGLSGKGRNGYGRTGVRRDDVKDR